MLPRPGQGARRPALGGREPRVHRGVHEGGHQRRLQPPAGDRDGSRGGGVMADGVLTKTKCDRRSGSPDGGRIMSRFNTYVVNNISVVM